MTRLFFVLTLLVGATNIWAQQTDPEQTLVKTIDPEEAEVVEFGFAHADLVTEPWEDTKIRMMIEIHSNMPEAIIEQLIKAGRYTIEPVFDDETKTMTITAPNTEKAVTIKGVDLDEQLFINVNMPSQFVRDGDKIRKDVEGITALIASHGGSVRGQEDKIRQIGYDIDIEFKIVSSVDADAFNAMVERANLSVNVDEEPSEAEEMGPARSSTPPSQRRGTAPPSLDDLKVEYGDIIMGGKPVGFE